MLTQTVLKSWVRQLPSRPENSRGDLKKKQKQKTPYIFFYRKNTAKQINAKARDLWIQHSYKRIGIQVLTSVYYFSFTMF